jgi:hypothetical protein
MNLPLGPGFSAKLGFQFKQGMPNIVSCGLVSQAATAVGFG